MALIDAIRTTANALEELASWANDHTAVADPLRRAARVLAGLAAKMAEVIATQAKAVQQVSSRMSVLNDILKQVNQGLSIHKDRGDLEVFPAPNGWMTGTEDELNIVRNIILAEGVTPDHLAPPVDNGDGKWRLDCTRRYLTNMQSVLQTSLESLSSTSQSDQARVQTTLGRYNACFDLVSSLIKKSETQGDAVGAKLGN
jgi:hypothetical protein